MKIAFFLSSFPTLSETFVLSQITGLADRGIYVDIYAHDTGVDKVTHPDVEKYALLNTTYYYGRNHQNMPQSKILRIVKALYLLSKNLANNQLPLFRSLNIFKYGRQSQSLSLFYTVAKLHQYQLNRYDIIHCHFGYMGLEVLTLKKLGFIKGKIITTFYGSDCSSFIKKYGIDLYDELFKYADVILCLSEEMKERLVKLGCPRDKIRIQHLGIDVARFQPDPSKYNNNGVLKLLTVGRMVEKKGIEYAIRAVYKLTEKYPDIEYTLIGDGPLRADLEHLCTELGISDYVRFLGPKNQTDIVDAMNRSDIFLAPSVTSENGDMEGTPTVLMEAQAMKMLVLSTFHSGIPEVVLDGRSGYLVPERNPDEIADKIRRLMEQSEMWNELRETGRKHIEKEFNTAVLSRRLERIYKSLLN